MQGFKNLIARRRPSVPHEGQAAPDIEAALTTPRPMSEEPVPPAEPEAVIAFSSADLRSKAMNARDHVPTPKLPARQNQKMMSGTPRSQPKSREATQDLPRSQPVRGRKIWDTDLPTPTRENTPVTAPKPRTQTAPRGTTIPRPMSGHTPQPTAAPQYTPRPMTLSREAARPQSDRAKTRLLGFHGTPSAPDIFSREPDVPEAGAGMFPIGWLVVVDGPGRGASFTLDAGLSTVGRDSDQTVCLDFGDVSISRTQHVAIAFDPDANRSFIGHGGKQNIVRLNGKPLLTTEALSDRDEIIIGKTTLRFVALCDGSFAWEPAHG